MNSLKKLRETKGLSIKDASIAVGVNPSTIFRIEHGTQFPTFETLTKLAAFYKLTPGQIIDPAFHKDLIK